MIINIVVRLKLGIAFVVIDEASDIIKNNFLSLFKLLSYSCNKFFHQISGITIIYIAGSRDSSNEKSVIMIKVPVERYFLDRWIKSVCTSVNAGWRIVSDKSSKTRNNNTIMPE